MRATPVDVSVTAADDAGSDDDASDDVGSSACDLLAQDCPVGACLPGPNGRARCVAAGPQQAGERCGPGLELCQAGLICVADDDGAAYACRVICDLTAGCAEAGETCASTGVTGMDGLGICDPL